MSTLSVPTPAFDHGARVRSGSDRPPEAPTVLFVDDDEQLLDGLRAVLRRRIGDYTMAFAPGALEALQYLDDHAVDLVVADIQMPTMNGVELLEAVRIRYPNALRYVLSGEAGSALMTEAVPVAHRWLTKPCNSDELATVIGRALSHRREDLIHDPDACMALAATSALPSSPALYTALQQLLADPEVEVAEVAALVATDPAVAAKVLQWANSALVGRPPVRDIGRAVARVGLETMAKLALSVDVARMLSESNGIPGFHPTQLMRYSQSTSALAARLVEPEDAVDASLVALLSPVGLLLESAALPARLRECYRLADESDRPLVEVERERYGHGHPELAVHLLSIWGLPVDLVDLVGQAFDRPRFDGPDSVRSGPLPVLDAVRVARLLTLHRMTNPSIGRPHLDNLSEEELDLLTHWERSLAPVPTNEEDGVVS